MNYKRCERPAPDTTIKLFELGESCTVYQNMLNRIDALRRQQNPWPPCDLERFDVKWQLINVMTYMFVLVDRATQETFEWSVVKAYPRETADHAWVREYNESAIRYNAPAYRALQDYVEALQDQFPTARYQLQERVNGWRAFRPITGKIGVVPFEMTFKAKPGAMQQDRMIHQDVWDAVSTIPGEAGLAVARMMQRQQKAGVYFNEVIQFVVKDYRTLIIKGHAFRDEETHTEVMIKLQEVAMSDVDLSLYHEYYTE